MLTEAQIEIVDETGHVEDRVRIVGTGEIALATKDRARLQSTSEDPADVDAIIALRGGTVTIEVKKSQALRVDDDFLPMAQPRFVPQGLNGYRRSSEHKHRGSARTSSRRALGIYEASPSRPR